MLLSRSSLLLGVCSLLLLSGCGASSYGTSTGTSPNSGGGVTTGGGNPPGDPIGGNGGPTGSSDSVVATPSMGSISVAVGAAQNVSITFTSTDGSAISGFGVSGTLGTLPAGWTGPTTFTCASVSTGSGCVLNLIYAPTAVGSGTLTVHYVYIDNATSPNTTGSLTIAYAATTHNNVVAAASPAGEINAVVGGGSQSVSVNFTTDDGNAASALTLTTSLAALPGGWSSTATSFSCPIVSTGNGCQLPLSFASTAAASGTLSVGYSYADDSGVARTGTVNIPYSTSSHDTVVATASPSGEINAIEKSGTQAVTVSFNTDDGKTATNLYLVSSLTALPPGWSSASNSLACSSVGMGNGCQLHLTYAPAALTGGTLVLNYAYTDAAGTPSTGSLNLAYAATTNDNAVATTSPVGQINAILGQGSQAVSVTFTTDDGRPATDLQLTSPLSALPAGWSAAPAPFTCNGFGGGNGCRLSLTYAPTTPGSGTLTLNYSYLNNAGEPKTGSVSIAYRATANNNIVWTPNQTSLAVVTGSITPLTVTFTTDDGNPVSGLSVSGLAALPSGWSSGSGSFACASVSTGAACQLSLTYAPTAVGGGMLSLTYGYNDNSGTAKTGTVSIPYAATQAYLYIAQYSGVYYCPLNTLDGTLGSCAATGGAFTQPTGIAFDGGNAYVADNGSNQVFLCAVAADGSLSGCTSVGTGFQNPWQLAIDGQTLYATNLSAAGGVTTCAIGSGGALSGCVQSSGWSGTAGIAVTPAYAYVGGVLGGSADSVNVCSVGLSGSLTLCAGTGGGFSSPNGISLSNGYAYVANQGAGTISVCSVGAGGMLSSCALSTPGSAEPMDVVINGNLAYIDDVTGDIYLCPVSAGGGGLTTPCIVSNGGGSFIFDVQIAIH